MFAPAKLHEFHRADVHIRTPEGCATVRLESPALGQSGWVTGYEVVDDQTTGLVLFFSPHAVVNVEAKL